MMNCHFHGRSVGFGLVGIALLLGFVCVSGWNCGVSESQPVDIEEGDVCSSCGMEITNISLASEIIFEGNVYKFDDLGCLNRYKIKNGRKIRGTTYVTDFVTKRWIDFDKATILPTSLATPMGSGLVAFADSARANAFARTHPPKVAM